MRARRRRGVAVLGIIVLLAIVHLAVIGSVETGGREAEVGALRLETLRARLAADSGVIVWMRQDAAGSAPPDGTTVAIGPSRIVFVSSVEPGEAGTVVVEGQSGRARQRVALEVE
jgi:hypothetical protein